MLIKKGRKKQNAPKSRKQLRKEARKNKKLRRHEYYTKRRKPGQFVRIDKKDLDSNNVVKEHNFTEAKTKENKSENKFGAEEIRNKEKKKQVKLQKEMSKQRRKQLVEANVEEDRTIKQLEKQLKLNKRKTKSVPKSFAIDGLDYLLEVCDPESMKTSALAEQQLTEINDEFEEDLALMTKESDDEDEENNNDSNRSDISGEETGSDEFNSEEELEDDTKEETAPKGTKRNSSVDRTENKKLRRSESPSSDNISENNSENEPENDNNSESEQELDDDDNLNTKKNADGTWEDIYGRLRSKDGSIIKQNDGKYIPPAVRMQMGDDSRDPTRNKKLDRLKKQLKGLFNRLAESNMHSISSQVEGLFMSNSRNDMNNTIATLVLEALVSNILAPERLLMEHIMLVTILHANIGTEVGAHFLQTVVKQFNEQFENKNVEDKKLDNIVIILSQLYNFKLFDSKLIFEILNKFAESFEEKDVECILHILKNVGFNLRKDDPLGLKNLILNLQKKASNVSEGVKDNSRIKFMIDILLAIKNNNVSKIPNYDTSYSEHLKKIMKGFIRKGNYVSQLNISLDDLLKAEEQGRWWVVGSAWTGHIADKNAKNNEETEKSNSFSQNLLELARKQRMNTDVRKNIFCIIMSSEDYLEAFEKLLRLSLRNQQERDIIHVILHCCLQEKKYNPFYAVLTQKFCEHDRKYQMTIKYSIWDKLKTLNEHSSTQISNLAKLLSYLIIEKGLPISVLKVVQFSDLDKITLRFMRQILLRILLHEDLEECKGVFEKVCNSDKLKMFRESLRLFVHHFLLRNLKSQDIPSEKAELLKSRFQIIEKLLIGREIKLY